MSEDTPSNVIDFKSKETKLVKEIAEEEMHAEPQEVSEYLKHEIRGLGKLKAFFFVSIADNGEIMCLKGSINILHRNALIGATYRCLHDFLTDINNGK